MGAIYVASLRREAGFERVLAVKKILPHLADDPAFVAMFEAEARLAARLHHPNVVQIYDFGRIGGESYIAMELVDGFDLRTLTDLAAAEGRPLPLGLAVHIAAECARALEYAWSGHDARGDALRIIHRDVSPQNILVSMQGETKLTDFGLAKTLSLDGGSTSGLVKGKLAYMAPEQMTGGAVSPASDLYAVGAVLYELATGRRVHAPDLSLGQVVARVTNGALPPLDDQTPAPLGALIHRCLALRPEDRPSAPGALVTELVAAARACHLETGSHALAQYVGRFANRRRVTLEVQGDGTVVAKRTHTPVQAVAARPSGQEVTRTEASPRPSAALGLNPEAGVSATEPTLAGTPPKRKTLQLMADELTAVATDARPEAAGPRPAAQPRRRGAALAVALLAVLGIAIWWLWPPPVASTPALAAQPAPPRPAPLVEAPKPPPLAVPEAPPGPVTVVLESRGLEGEGGGWERRPYEADGPEASPVEPPVPVVEPVEPPPTEAEPNDRFVRVGRERRTVAVGAAWTVEVPIQGGSARVRVSVGRRGAQVHVIALPWAVLSVNGVTKGETPRSVNVGLGRHTLALTRSGQTVGRVPLVLRMAPE